MFPPMWLYNVSISVVVFCEKRTTKIKHPLKRKGGYLWWRPCCRWQRLCLLFLEWQPYPPPAIVVDHAAYLFLMTIFSAMVLFCSIHVRLICHDSMLEATYCLFFYLVNNKGSQMAAVIHGRSQCQHNGLVGDVFPKFDITNPHPSISKSIL